MLSEAMHTQEGTPLEPRSLPARRRFEGFMMPAEPDLDDAIATHPLVDAASNGFHLGKFRHRSIVEDGRRHPG
jgi:hypothetical protein